MTSSIDEAVQKHMYALSNDQKEFERLNSQHVAFLLMFDGLYPCKDRVREVLRTTPGETKRILDLGSGSGIWCCQMALEFPEASVTGLDIKLSKQDEIDNIPPNCKFVVGDINKGLSEHHGLYDLVFMRAINGGILDHRATMLDAERCLKPGGLVISIAVDRVLAEDRISFYPPATSQNLDDSWLHRIIFFICNGMTRQGYDRKGFTGVYDQGLWDDESCDRSTCGAIHVTVPIGPWATASDPVQAARLKRLGELWRDSCQAMQYNHPKIYSKWGRTSKDTELLHKKVDEELQNGQKRQSLRFRVLYGQAPKDGVTTIAEKEETNLPDESDGYIISTTYHDQKAWLELSNKINASETPDMQRLEFELGYDLIEAIET